MTTGWNKPENALRSQSELFPGFGIGLAHAYSGTVAIDVDYWDRAKQELSKHDIDLQSLYTAPDAVTIESGRVGHGKLLYKMPEGIVLPSKKLTDVDSLGNRYNYLDFRCATANGLTVQDVLPPSIHPDTREPYRWGGTGHWTRLPVIPDVLLNVWRNLIEQDRNVVIPQGETFPTSFEEVQDALWYISADCDRKTWIDIGCALHLFGVQHDIVDAALNAWNEWSQGSIKYPGQRDILSQWRVFRSDKAKVVTVGTLFKLAKSAGWTRPTPDVTHMFHDVANVITPQVIVDGMTPMTPDLPLDLLPPMIRQRAEEVSQSIGCDPIVPFLAGMAAVCAVADAQSRLELLPGFEVPPLAWFATIGDPADKKTPGSAPMFQVLSEIEKDDLPRFKKAMHDWEGIEAMHASSKKAYLDFAASSDALLNMEGAPVVTELPSQPQPLRLIVSDVTSQKLVRQCADRPRGLLCYLDEMNGWLTKLTDPRSGEDRSAWVRAYEAKRYEMDRVGAGSIIADNFAVAIYGNIQPNVLRHALPSLSSDGLIQRFLPVMLRKSTNKRGEPIPEYLTNKATWDLQLRLIYSLPTMKYTLSPGAYEAFRQFQTDYESQKQDEWLAGSPSAYMTAYGKIEGLTGRLMFLFHLIENPFSTVVSAELAQRTIDFIKIFVIPSLRYVFAEVGNGVNLDRWIAEYVIQHADEQTLTMGTIRSAARRQLEKYVEYSHNAHIFSAMHVLEQAKWVIRIDDGSKEQFGRAEWAINPNLLTMFAEYRDKIINAKRRIADSFKHGSYRIKIHGEKTTNEGDDNE